MRAKQIEFSARWAKYCSKCSTSYEATTRDGLLEFFNPDKARVDAFRMYCRACSRRLCLEQRNRPRAEPAQPIMLEPGEPDEKN